MKKKLFELLAICSLSLAVPSCQKNNQHSPANLEATPVNFNQGNEDAFENRIETGYLPISLTIYNPCCQEEVHLSGLIHQVENSNVIHMDSRSLSGIGLTTGLDYIVASSSVRNYQFDPNEYLSTLNWSVRMKREDGCDYDVQFVIHITHNAEGEIVANIHSGNFFCH